MGKPLASAELRRDHPAIQGALRVIAAIDLLVNFAIDLLCTVVKPRVQV